VRKTKEKVLADAFSDALPATDVLSIAIHIFSKKIEQKIRISKNL
jgi:hypothetical protein